MVVKHEPKTKSEGNKINLTFDEINLIEEALKKYSSGETKKEFEVRLKSQGYKSGYILIDANLDDVMVNIADLHKTWWNKNMRNNIEKSSDQINKEAESFIWLLRNKLGDLLKDVGREDIIMYRHEADHRFTILGPTRFRLAIAEKHFEQLQEILLSFSSQPTLIF